MPHAERAGDRINVLFAWNEKDRLLTLGGSRYRRDDHGRDVISYPLSWGSCQGLRGMFGPQLTVGPELSEYIRDLKNTRINYAMMVRDRYSREDAETFSAYDLDNPFGPNLKPFQSLGVSWMMAAQSAILGDEMGSGKTVQMLSFLDRVEDTLPALIVVPNSTKYHWRNLSRTWCPRGTPYVVDGTAVKRRKILAEAAKDPTALVIINLESVRSFSRLAPYGSIKLRRCEECDPQHGDGIKATQCEIHPKELNAFGFRSVVLDEAHRVKGPQSKQTRAIWHVMHASAVEYRWALTGTPIEKHPGDLWSLLYSVAPEDFPVKSKFVERYCLTQENAFGGREVIGLNPATMEEFRRVFEWRFRRMLKSITQPQLPPILREVRTCELKPKQQKVYEELDSTLTADTGDGNLLITWSDLTKNGRLQQLASSSVEIQKPDPDNITTWKIQMVEPSPKLDAMEEVLDDIGYATGEGAKVAIAAVNVDLVHMAAARLRGRDIPCATITGDDSPAEREAALESLRQGTIQAVVFSVAAGAEGLDMSAADTLIMLQRPWSMIKVLQTEGRIHRMGSEIHEAVRIIDIVTRGTVEEDQVERVLRKLGRLEEITRDQEARERAQVEQDPAALQEERSIMDGDVMAGHDDGRTPEQQAEIDRRMMDPVGSALASLPPVNPETHPDTATVSDPLLVQLADTRTEEQPERVDCFICGKDSKVNADGTIRHHFAKKPEHFLGPDSRRCKGVGEQWNHGAAEQSDGPEPDDMGECAECHFRYPLTSNDRIRTHLSRIVQPGPDNKIPNCGGGSGEPVPGSVRKKPKADPAPEQPAVEDVQLPEPSCEKCDTDAHTCPGCGIPVLHMETACAECDTRAAAESVIPSAEQMAAQRVLVTGSRTWGELPEQRLATEQERTTAAAERAALKGALSVVFRPGVTLVSGACPKGADALAEAIWKTWGGQVERHPAEWTRLDGTTDKQAGFRRNAEMVATDPDIVLAFSKNHSKGTQDTIDKAARSGRRVIVKHSGETLEPGVHMDQRTAEEHYYDDHAGGLWIHGGPRHLCHQPECMPPAVPAEPSGGLLQNAKDRLQAFGDAIAATPCPACTHPLHPMDTCGTCGCTSDQMQAALAQQVKQENDQQITELADGTQQFLDLAESSIRQADNGTLLVPRIIETEILPDQVISATKMRDWQQCRRKWWLKWYRSLDTAGSDLTDKRNTGIRIHEALAGWYVPDGQTPVDPRVTLRESLLRDWRLSVERSGLSTDDAAYSVLREKWAKAGELEKAMVEGYMEWVTETAADQGYRIVGSEEERSVTIQDPKTGMTILVRGVLDARRERIIDGVREFIDHKTVAAFDRATKFIEMNVQMLHYHLIEWLSTEEGEKRCDGAVYNMLRRVKRSGTAKPPFYQRQAVPHSEIQLKAYKAHLVGAAREMARAEQALERGEDPMEVVFPSPSGDCDWSCDFRTVCPLFNDGSRVEDMITMAYRPGNPWLRYDGLQQDTQV